MTDATSGNRADRRSIVFGMVVGTMLGCTIYVVVGVVPLIAATINASRSENVYSTPLEFSPAPQPLSTGAPVPAYAPAPSEYSSPAPTYGELTPATPYIPPQDTEVNPYTQDQVDDGNTTEPSDVDDSTED